MKIKNYGTYQSLVNKGEELIQSGDKTYQEIKIDKDALSVLLFTSGTTKQPKAVMLSQYNICSNITALSGHSRMYETDTLLSFLPLHHTFECTITFLYGLYFGVTIAFCDGLKYIQKNLAEYEVTALVAVPLVLENMYKKLQKGIHDSGKENVIKLLSKISKLLLKCKIDIRKQLFKPVTSKLGGKLRIIFYGAAPMDKATIIGFNELGVDLIQGYGLTETSPVLACETDNDKEPGSVGYPLSNVDIQIQNPNEEGIGEIVVKGSSVMKGYYEDPEETEKVLKDGWFNTEDLGYLDEKGHLFVTGRKKDVIVLKNGKNIYPQEIEYIINKLPYVEESIVYATDSTEKDNKISAKIVYKKEIMESLYPEKQSEYQSIIWDDIKQINKTIPDYKHIKKIIITTEPLEKTTTHKVKRFKEISKMSK